jgi:hypothetical protein
MGVFFKKTPFAEYLLIFICTKRYHNKMPEIKLRLFINL